MKPYVLCIGAGLFVLGMALHVALWRRRHPRRHLLALIGVFLLPWAGFALAAFLGRRSLPSCRVTEWPAVSLLYFSLACAYIQTYPAIQALSPSLRILLMLRNARREGMTEGEILERLHPPTLLADRVEDLVQAGMLRRSSDGTLMLAPHSVVLVLPFVFLRKLLGLDAGKG